MNTNDRMVSLVRELHALITNYGADEVQHAYNYITSFPNADTVLFTDHDGNTWGLTTNQAFHITRAYADGNGFIMAIKMFREFTGCGLKEAKGAIEKYFNRSAPRY